MFGRASDDPKEREPANLAGGVAVNHSLTVASCVALLALGSIGGLEKARADTVTFHVTSMEALNNGQTFGNAGGYKHLRGVAEVKVERRRPGTPSVDGLSQIGGDNAPSILLDFDVLTPSDAAKASGRVAVEPANRGREMIFSLLAGARSWAGDPIGDGWMLRQGWTVVSLGWEDRRHIADPKGLAAVLPVLNGVEKEIRVEFLVPQAQGAEARRQLRLPYPAVTPPTVQVVEPDGARAVTKIGAYSLNDPQTLALSPPFIDLSQRYEVDYRASKPSVGGLGYVGVRDVVEQLRAHPDALDADLPRVRAIYAVGISQSARMLRDFVYQGFNQGNDGPVFDGALIYAAGAGRTDANTLFGQPFRSRWANQDRDDDEAFRFPFAYAETRDPVSGKQDSLLHRCTATHTCPRILQIDSENEYWQKGAALVTSDLGGRDLPAADNVRVYLMASTAHFTPAGVSPKPQAFGRFKGTPLYSGPVLKALLADLDAWCVDGRAPPESRVPRHADGGLIRAANDHQFPFQAGAPADFPLAAPANASVPVYPNWTPRRDVDGMDISGVRLPDVAAPLRTYLGVNPMSEPWARLLLGPTGSSIELPLNASEAGTTHDPRRPILARYPTITDYEQAVSVAIDALVADRLMLEEDRLGVSARLRLDYETLVAKTKVGGAAAAP